MIPISKFSCRKLMNFLSVFSANIPLGKLRSALSKGNCFLWLRNTDKFHRTSHTFFYLSDQHRFHTPTVFTSYKWLICFRSECILSGALGATTLAMEHKQTKPRKFTIKPLIFMCFPRSLFALLYFLSQLLAFFIFKFWICFHKFVSLSVEKCFSFRYVFSII